MTSLCKACSKWTGRKNTPEYFDFLADHFPRYDVICLIAFHFIKICTVKFTIGNNCDPKDNITDTSNAIMLEKISIYMYVLR